MGGRRPTADSLSPSGRRGHSAGRKALEIPPGSLWATFRCPIQTCERPGFCRGNRRGRTGLCRLVNNFVGLFLRLRGPRPDLSAKTGAKWRTNGRTALPGLRAWLARRPLSCQSPARGAPVPARGTPVPARCPIPTLRASLVLPAERSGRRRGPMSGQRRAQCQGNTATPPHPWPGPLARGARARE